MLHGHAELYKDMPKHDKYLKMLRTQAPTQVLNTSQ